MKNKYDFSKGQRGKFFKDDVVMRVPLYLEPGLQRELEQMAERRGTDFEELVSLLLEHEINNDRNGS